MSSSEISFARARACATPRSLKGQRTSTFALASPRAPKTLSPWRTRSARSIRARVLQLTSAVRSRVQHRAGRRRRRGRLQLAREGRPGAPRSTTSQRRTSLTTRPEPPCSRRRQAQGRVEDDPERRRPGNHAHGQLGSVDDRRQEVPCGLVLRGRASFTRGTAALPLSCRSAS
jgi:hypothetical protein